MKSLSPQLIALLNTGGPYEIADLYTVTFRDASVARWSNADMDLVLAGNTFSAAGPLIQRNRVRTIVGLEVDTLDLTLHRGDALTLNGLPIPLAAATGAFDGASVRLERVFMPVWGDTTPGSIVLFEGNVANVHPTSTSVRVEVKSELERLNVAMPHTVYQPQCSHALYDPGCGLSRAAFTVTGALTLPGSPTDFVTNRAEASGYFVLGVLTMTSGPAAGAKRAVKAYAAGAFTLAIPLPAAPNAGDTFTVYPGCDKRLTTCTSKFANAARFRGFPLIPRPEQAR
jgi:uncharacterized phage protein (TIGR02218 family)